MTTPQVTADSPRLQDVLDRRRGRSRSPCTRASTSGSSGQELEADAAESLERANATGRAHGRAGALPSAYWVRIGERAHIRLVLPDDEDAATDALARLHAAGDDALGGETRLLGAFRACGLLVPVWDLDPELEAADHEERARRAGASGTPPPSPPTPRSPPTSGAPARAC